MAPPVSQPSSADFPGVRGAATQGSMVALQEAPGYIDSALIANQFRLRFDSAYRNNRPDRAEFLYPKCGCFRTIPVRGGNPALGLVRDPNAPGPMFTETKIDFQDITGYLEVALNPNISGFIEVPFEFLNPEVNANTAGLSDMNVGFKYAFVNEPDQVATFQFRTVIPTGAASHGLGTDHVSVEPAVLFFQRLGERWTLDAEFRGWIPIGGSDFAGNILRYGVGLGYTAYQEGSLRITPIAELVGWTVLDGKEVATDGLNTATGQAINTRVLDASGDTIINAKIGVRIGVSENSSIYAGYGRALTGDVWYKDIWRLEYRLTF